MKIIQATKYFHPHIGGIESNVLDISTRLAAKGITVTILTSNIPRTKRTGHLNDIKILRSHSLFTFSKDPFTPGILIDLLKEDYDLIHLHLPDPFNSVFVWLASRIRKKPYIITYHADIIREGWIYGTLNRVYSPILNRILQDSERILATTPNYVEGSTTLNKAGIREKIEIMPNFVDAERFNPRIERSRCIEKLGLTELGDKRIILFLGRLVPYKGVEYLIKAFPRVKERIGDAFLLIVGDGPLREKLEKLASGTDDVLITGRQNKEDDSSIYYPICDVFVLPSITRQEAFGISLVEAMACGKPCITTNISGMPYVVGDGGIIVKPRDPDGLASAITELLSDPERINELGRKARIRVESEFTPKKVTEKVFSLYKAVLKE